eukprot:1650124-Amphidinium_carterae.1
MQHKNVFNTPGCDVRLRLAWHELTPQRFSERHAECPASSSWYNFLPRAAWAAYTVWGCKVVFALSDGHGLLDKATFRRWPYLSWTAVHQQSIELGVQSLCCAPHKSRFTK